MTAAAGRAPSGPVLYDLTGAQSPEHRSRGIGRYVTELAAALEEVAGDRVGAFVVDPAFALPPGVEPLVASGRLLAADEILHSPESVVHVASPYELSVPLRRLWPEAAERAGAALVVTLYDVIPEVLGGPYLADPEFRERYRARHELVRAADAVLAISESTARDGIERLRLDPRRVHVIGAGVSPRLLAVVASLGAAPAPRVAGLRERFVLYTGGADPRKNVEGLLTAWSGLDPAVRQDRQLVIVCGLTSLERNHLEVEAARLGVTGDVLLPGFVDDDTLAALYRACDLFVFPSRYEGYGLPIAEALACGAPVVAADRSSLPELVAPEGLFDPDDPDDMARVITAALEDGPTRSALLAHTRSTTPPSWADVARAATAVYDDLIADRSRRPARVRRPESVPAPAAPVAPARPRRQPDGPVLFDLSGAQNVQYQGRGIPRYVAELASALAAVEPDRIGAFMLNPDLPPPSAAGALRSSGKLLPADEVIFGPDSVVHVPSPYELSVPLRRLWPEAAERAGAALVVTLHDLIPEVLAAGYLADPGLRQRYRARHQLVRSADAVIAVSASTARDGIERLGLDAGRVHVIGEGVSPTFSASGPGPVLDGLRDRFVLYTGAPDPRKNVEGLLAAWALVDPSARRGRQLVIVCRLAEPERHHFEVLADRAGIEDEVLLPGFVDDATLAALYRACDLFVFPSRYEGYGLPIAEALACGAPVVAADRSCLPELVAPQGLFDPDEPADMAGVITAALGDTPTREALVAHTGTPPRTWADVARATASVYDLVSGTRRRPRHRNGAARPSGSRGRLRIAVVTPLPPQPSGVADYSYLLLEELAEYAEITALVDGPPHHRAEQRAARAPAGIPVLRTSALEQAESIGGAYDAVVYTLGNSEFHTGALAALQRRPGIVYAHDVRLTDLYRFAPHQHPRALAARGPDAFHRTLHALYPGLPADLGAGGGISAEEADRYGVLMARQAVAASTHFLATSEYAATLARLDAGPKDRHKVRALPLAIGVHAIDPGRRPADGNRNGPPVVASFGLVNERKQTGVLLDALAAVAGRHPDARLAVVGPAGEAELAGLRARADRLGLAGRVEFTGRVEPAEYGRWLQRTTVAVQLRDHTNGETSGAVGACLASGVPTVVTAIGPARELPTGSVAPLPAFARPEEVAAAIDELLGDPNRQVALARAAQDYAATRTFGRTARRLYDFVVESTGAEAGAGDDDGDDDTSPARNRSYRSSTVSQR